MRGLTCSVHPKQRVSGPPVCLLTLGQKELFFFLSSHLKLSIIINVDVSLFRF